jgi:hypothetical protein
MRSDGDGIAYLLFIVRIWSQFDIRVVLNIGDFNDLSNLIN